MKRNGFTLIELLAIIAILGLLAAILVPVFARVRENGRRSVCLSNERQIGLAFLQYEQESNERFPQGSVKRANWDPPSETPPSGEGWAGQIYPYLKSTPVFQCPNDPTPPAPPAAVVSYGYNDWMPASSQVKAMPARVLTPAKTVLLFEVAGSTAQVTSLDEGASGGRQRFSASGDGGILASWPGGAGGECKYATGWMGDVDPYRSGSSQFPERTGRHANGANYLLADGHVKWLLPGQVLANNHPKVSDTEFDRYEAHFVNENPHPQ